MSDRPRGPPKGYVAFDMDDGVQAVWSGPGISPVAVAAVFRLFGYEALLNHAGLTAIRMACCWDEWAPVSQPEMCGRARGAIK